MNNIYVDELPKNCIDCPCESESYCNLLNIGIDIREHIVTPHCPLKPLTDRLAEERKKVVQEIRNKVEQAKLVYEWKGDEVHIEDILDQIERNGNDNK